jgi:hypothetical protein
MKTIIYFLFFHPNVLFSDRKHLCPGDEFTHSIFCETVTHKLFGFILFN